MSSKPLISEPELDSKLTSTTPPDMESSGSSLSRKISHSSSSLNEATMTDSTSSSLASEIRALLRESSASLDDAVSRPLIPIKSRRDVSTGHQLLAAVLEAHLKLEKEKMDMRFIIGNLEQKVMQLNSSNGFEQARDVQSRIAHEGKKAFCGECEILRMRAEEAEEELQKMIEGMLELKKASMAHNAELQEVYDELRKRVD